LAHLAAVMENFGASLGWGLAVGASLVVGAVAAALLRLPSRVAAALTAFGGGVLFAAIAFELVPEADGGAGVALTAIGLLAGTLIYVSADAWLSRDHNEEMMRRSAHAAAAGQPMMMRSAEGEIGVALLAGVLVGNVVEAYGAAQPIVAGGHTRRFAITLLAVIGAALALATLLGGTALADASGDIVGTAQAIAAGAVLAVITIAIVPHAFEEVSRLAAAATALGFLTGYLLS
jgi:ZIP family zinc transporter